MLGGRIKKEKRKEGITICVQVFERKKKRKEEYLYLQRLELLIHSQKGNEYYLEKLKVLDSGH